MNSIRKHPTHFSLNIGKLLSHDNGQNPHIVYYQLSDIKPMPILDTKTTTFQEFVIDACQLTNPQPLFELLMKLKEL